jgi:putative oxidoreductase
MSNLSNAADLVGRILIAAIFLISGLGKISGYADTQAYIAAHGVPGALLPLVIAAEVLGAVAIMIGYRTRIVAAVLAVFTLAAALLFHNVPGDQTQQLMLLKNVAIAGGFLILFARGAGGWSLDARALTRSNGLHRR